MRILESAAELSASSSTFRRPVATVGVFDGVHRGHRHLIEGLCAWRDEAGDGETAVITFREHPMTVLGHISPAIITSLDHRLLLLDRAGIDLAVVLRFDLELASWPAERFVDEIIVRGLSCGRLLMGYNSALGAGAQGTAEYLRAHPGLDIDVREMRPFLLDGHPVSSTEVRSAILKGELEKATRMLGRPVSIYGEVIHGDGRGKSLGFPTANLNLFHSAAPPHGVYLASVEIDSRRYGALVNIGRRPTFMRPDDPLDYSRYFNEQLDKVEIFVNEYQGNLYGRRLEAMLAAKLRDERRFENSGELVAQIHRDLQALLVWWKDTGSFPAQPAGG